MIVDHIDRAEKYYAIHPNFRRAFEFLRHSNIHTLNEGTHPINGEEAYVIISKSTSQQSAPLPPLEAHRKYIDIQIPLEGSFAFGWKALEQCAHNGTPYDYERDVQNFSNQPAFVVPLTQGMFTILFPEDAHAPHPPEQALTKAVVKVAV